MRSAFDKLKESRILHYDRLKPFRERRVEALAHYVGPYYGNRTGAQQEPVNLIELGVNTYLQHLVPRTPQTRIVPRKVELWSSASDMEDAINQILLQIRFETTIRLATLEGLFGLGVVKVGITGEEGEYPFAEVTLFDDWVHDTKARSIEEFRFCGNRYPVDLEEVLSNENFDEAARSELRNSSGEESSPFEREPGKKAEDLSRSRGSSLTGDDDDLYRSVELWDLWLPKENVILTFAEGNTKPLSEAEWGGPASGPYRLLRFNEVSGNVMPLPPVFSWMDLHILVNNLYCKLGEQASQQKTVNYARLAGGDDAERIVNAENGSTIGVQDPQNVKSHSFPGPDNQVMGFAAAMRQLASYMMGNIDVLAGLSSQAGTASQENLLHSSASNRVNSMQSRVSDLTRYVIRDMAWWMWPDPMVRVPFVKKIEGTEYQGQSSWPYQKDERGIEQDVRGGDFNDYDFEVKPYSLSDQSPEQALARIEETWRQDIVPLAPILEAQGLKLNAAEYLKVKAKYAGIPELSRIVEMTPPTHSPGSPSGEMRPRKPASTTREYIRRGESKQGGLPAEQDMMAGASNSTPV
jgi:hypothetical protein